MRTIKCSCNGDIYSIGTSRFKCAKCRKEYKKNCFGYVRSFEDLEVIKRG